MDSTKNFSEESNDCTSIWIAPILLVLLSSDAEGGPGGGGETDGLYTLS